MKRLFLGGLGLLFFGIIGCAVGPDYTGPPQANIQKSWTEANTSDKTFILQENEKIRNWWVVFNDPLLNQLIETADAQNLDLKIAIAKVSQARAQLAAYWGDVAPQINAQGVVLWGDASAGSTISGATSAFVWEIDLFGRVRRQIEAAKASFEASQEDRVAVMVSIYAEVAQSYITIRSFQAQIDALEKNIHSQKQLLHVINSRFQNGLATALDVASAERLLSTLEAQLPPLLAQKRQTENMLAVLLGGTPEEWLKTLNAFAPIPIAPDSVMIDAPVNMLRQRPDIRRAERTLAAEVAAIGVVKADLFPSFYINGTFNLGAADAATLFQTPISSYSYGPSLRWNIFQGGKTLNLIKAQDAKAMQALYMYEKTVLTAMKEVESALTGYLQAKNQFKADTQALEAANRSYLLSIDLYESGLADLQRVLENQKELCNIIGQYTKSRGTVAINLVALYRALGGGWDPKNPPQIPEKISEREIKDALSSTSNSKQELRK